MRMHLITKFLITILFLLSSVAHATEWQKYQGTTNESDEALTRLCLDYMQRGYMENRPVYYLHLLPPKAADLEEDILKSFERYRQKRFKGVTQLRYETLQVDEVAHGEYKGKKTIKIKLVYQGKGAAKKYHGSCSFEQNEDNKWYLTKHP